MKTGFFEEAPEEKSMIRLMSFMVLCVALAIALFQAWKTGTIDLPGFMAMAGMAFGAKVWQKIEEVKEQKNEPEKPV